MAEGCNEPLFDRQQDSPLKCGSIILAKQRMVSFYDK